MNRKVILAALIVAPLVPALIGLALFWFQPEATIYLDNQGNDAVQVWIDANELSLQAREWRMIKVPTGTRTVKIERNGNVTVEEKSFDRKRYVLNLEPRGYYCSFRIDYESMKATLNRLQKGLPDIGASLATEADLQSVFPEQRARGIKSLFEKTARLIPEHRIKSILATERWLDVSEYDHAMDPPPKSIQVAEGNEKLQRSVFLRISAEDYDALSNAGSKANPTFEELEKLHKAVNLVLTHYRAN